jgi:hypothetical protein
MSEFTRIFQGMILGGLMILAAGIAAFVIPSLLAVFLFRKE